jgi:hypothetical protein
MHSSAVDYEHNFTVELKMALWWTVYCNITVDIPLAETIEPCKKCSSSTFGLKIYFLQEKEQYDLDLARA